ncbi:MAG: NAD-dependent dehydratase [Elusimicrobia bacterium RIFOXYC2_FULL_34_12]|nr:MAG: NAD-dependent dehydratase [Elusimicrobia bacterium RIFOXYC2_FULL_34_12]OGS38457.1 MAG: NAD-dependent dehydratase [Elusimicrobia bacterium RIFOXYD2_FULL_34_30]HAM38263.1 NAD-dependent dehydratase [Elusimicrobiota bacterium]
MNWKKQNVFVTGASGFIGSHLVEHLINLGAKVTVLLEYTPYNDMGCLKFLTKNILNEIEQIPGDLRDPELVKKFVEKKDVIFHLAALVGIPYSFVNPREVFEVNALGTLNILLAARDANVKKIVTTSTSETYGTALYTPIDEKHPLQAQSPYSASKIAADKIAESFYKTYNIPVAVIRPFNTYGPRQSDRAIIPTIIIQALMKNVINIGSTTPRRDLNYVSDTVNGFIKIAESDKSIGQVINIGAGKDISVGELAQLILSIMRKKIRIVSTEKRKRPEKSEVMQLLCDNRKAKKLVGWEPKVSLKEGLTKTIQWIKKHPEYYSPDKYQI